jgi:glucokinase
LIRIDFKSNSIRREPDGHTVSHPPAFLKMTVVSNRFQRIILRFIISSMTTQPTVAAVDIGGTKIAAGIVSRDGRILAQESCPTAPEQGFEPAMRRTAAMLRRCMAEAAAHPQAIGVGCTGPVDPFTGALGDVNLLPGWQGCNLVGALSAGLGLPAVVENDGDASALGEAAFGVGRGARSFLLVAVGTGIGVGIVLEGRLYRGVGGAHPELGHIVLDPAGPPCTCGARGCWEAFASGPALEDWFNTSHPQPERWDGRRICAAADQLHEAALSAARREGYYLGLGLANLINCFCPDVIGLAGGLLERFDLFEPEALRAIRENCRLVPYEQVRLLRAELGGRTGLLGAAQAWWNRAG